MLSNRRVALAAASVVVASLTISSGPSDASVPWGLPADVLTQTKFVASDVAAVRVACSQPLVVAHDAVTFLAIDDRWPGDDDEAAISGWSVRVHDPGLRASGGVLLDPQSTSHPAPWQSSGEPLYPRNFEYTTATIPGGVVRVVTAGWGVSDWSCSIAQCEDTTCYGSDPARDHSRVDAVALDPSAASYARGPEFARGGGVGLSASAGFVAGEAAAAGHLSRSASGFHFALLRAVSGEYRMRGPEGQLVEQDPRFDFFAMTHGPTSGVWTYEVDHALTDSVPLLFVADVPS